MRHVVIVILVGVVFKIEDVSARCAPFLIIR
jgi:hypothetical protein